MKKATLIYVLGQWPISILVTTGTFATGLILGAVIKNFLFWEWCYPEPWFLWMYFRIWVIYIIFVIPLVKIKAFRTQEQINKKDV